MSAVGRSLHFGYAAPERSRRAVTAVVEGLSDSETQPTIATNSLLHHSID